MSHNPEQENQYFIINPEQAAQFSSAEREGRNFKELAASIGAVAGEGAFGVVVDTDEHGNQMPSHLIRLDDDFGTAVRPNGEDREARFLADHPGGLTGAYEQAAARNAPQEQAEDLPEDIDNEQAVIDLLADSEFTEELSRFDRIAESLEQSSVVGRRQVTALSDELNMLRQRINMGMQDNPSARFLRDNPDLRRYIGTAIETTHSASRTQANISQESDDSLKQFALKTQDTGEAVASDLQRLQTEEAHNGQRAVEGVVESVQQLQVYNRRQSEASADTFTGALRIVQQLEDVSLPVEEALDMTTRVLSMLEPSGRGALDPAIDEVRDRIAQFRRNIQK